MFIHLCNSRLIIETEIGIRMGIETEFYSRELYRIKVRSSLSFMVLNHRELYCAKLSNQCHGVKTFFKCLQLNQIIQLNHIFSWYFKNYRKNVYSFIQFDLIFIFSCDNFWIYWILHLHYLLNFALFARYCLPCFNLIPVSVTLLISKNCVDFQRYYQRKSS